MRSGVRNAINRGGELREEHEPVLLPPAPYAGLVKELDQELELPLLPYRLFVELFGDLLVKSFI